MPSCKPDAAVGVCGAGIMGSGIAQLFAIGKHRVFLTDSDPAALARAEEKISADLHMLVARQRLGDQSASDVTGRISFSRGLGDFQHADLVIEAVVEDISVKQRVFRHLEEVCPPHTVLATNTSILSVSEISAVLKDASRAVGTHFFNPADRMKLVELTPGLGTAKSTVDNVKTVLEQLGKTVVVVREFPGGIVSRLQILLRNEAVRMVTEGVASAEDVDTAMKLGSGWPMGPLELIDLVGADLHVRNSETLASEMGSNRYQPHPVLRQMVRAGKLGRKTGSGFYEYKSRKNNE